MLTNLGVNHSKSFKEIGDVVQNGFEAASEPGLRPGSDAAPKILCLLDVLERE